MSKDIAQILLDTQAVFLSVEKPFTWASGIQSPIYCDNRKVLAFPKERETIKQAFLNILKEYDYDAIIGTATAGIPMASILADATNKPLGYVRSSKKDHGRQNQIEGFSKEHSKVIVVEDLISTGKSVLKVVDALKEAGIEVIAVIAIFSYNMHLSQEQFSASGVSYRVLSDFNTLMQLALEQGMITSQQEKQLKKFQNNPQNNEWIQA
ncbi:orotate phosphoribosyltransferase [Carnobacteriaceae bacterium zg-84]|uniref:orotate phosphoribosyltransferase n=1 Tax=Granulicatella sp. zg-84 TaxID=2678503 RepID=UPI0013C16C7E|nr:orotate phosphoribosyltransferase [Granulicatella sp. zg-84]NEW66438.1 orotate phosphoribosyltransferase [Granulicatella sp. zg-84]QMI86358.1 orotate phosphoribosyltransferase [Carnobacteriaceae bacterium zg-84]